MKYLKYFESELYKKIGLDVNIMRDAKNADAYKKVVSKKNIPFTEGDIGTVENIINDDSISVKFDTKGIFRQWSKESDQKGSWVHPTRNNPNSTIVIRSNKDDWFGAYKIEQFEDEWFIFKRFGDNFENIVVDGWDGLEIVLDKMMKKELYSKD